MSPNKFPSGPKEVYVYKMDNNLKKKLGMHAEKIKEGFLSEASIEEADRMVAKYSKDGPETIDTLLNMLIELWAEMRDMPKSTERDTLSEQVFTVSHQIKDIAALCGQDLISDFAESLRDYVTRASITIDAQKKIIQAHVDALVVIQKKGIDDINASQAEELKKMVKIAIQKYI